MFHLKKQFIDRKLCSFQGKTFSHDHCTYRVILWYVIVLFIHYLRVLAFQFEQCWILYFIQKEKKDHSFFPPLTIQPLKYNLMKDHSIEFYHSLATRSRQRGPKRAAAVENNGAQLEKECS